MILDGNFSLSLSFLNSKRRPNHFFFYQLARLRFASIKRLLKFFSSFKNFGFKTLKIYRVLSNALSKDFKRVFCKVEDRESLERLRCFKRSSLTGADIGRDQLLQKKLFKLEKFLRNKVVLSCF